MKTNTILKLLLFISSFTVSQNTFFYGLSRGGGDIDRGTIFRTDSNGENFTHLHQFLNDDGGNQPYGSLLLANNGKLYGMTAAYGKTQDGVIFEFDIATNNYVVIHDFYDSVSSNSTGSTPYGSLIQANNGNLYGVTNKGGLNGRGVIFEYNITTNNFTKLHDFDYSTGSKPYGSLLETSNGNLYGLTFDGGENGYGVIFEFNPTTNTYNKKLDLDATSGRRARGSLIEASNGKLYGMTNIGATNSDGAIIEYDISLNTLTVKFNFDSTSGKHPYGDLVEANNGKLYGLTLEGGVNDLGTLFEFDLTTNTYTKKIDFDGTVNGSSPRGTLLLASNGNLYGMTYYGGSNNTGVLFEYNYKTNTFTKKIDFYERFVSPAFAANPQYTKLIEVNTSALSIDKQNVLNVMIFPNPVKNKITINSNYQIEKLQIYTLNGQLLKEEKQTNQINIETLSKGLYVLKVTTNMGFKSQKIIVE
ncbi:choice-of-anchor tandem repeat GloVer-containing protein [Polaribacter sp. Z022]|uniref:choice-of-anchor tandem repeat GloVer-containing protein n=1 Tax=Polaribacter sp. Z022 TaxID=2927125 RepID=UPI002020894D|nr:choice-of-anchor tandem repeat GloVer-containing protein [Polaribacter sp. Z022]MCL7753724.1 T9SS type A sorting domain-containing protein [Polaribacter sp. Z022]